MAKNETTGRIVQAAEREKAAFAAQSGARPGRDMVHAMLVGLAILQLRRGGAGDAVSATTAVRALWITALAQVCAAALWLLRLVERLVQQRKPQYVFGCDTTTLCCGAGGYFSNWYCPHCGAVCTEGVGHVCAKS